MPSAAVEAAFRARLATWGGTVVENSAASPPEGATQFAVLQYPVANAERPVLGRRFFEEGAARIVLNVSSETPLPTALATADTIAALFRADKSFAPGIETFAPSPPLINDSNLQGNWVELAVIVPYRYQFDG